jgi:hypothetical protein
MKKPFKVLIEAESKEMAYIIGLEIASKLGMNPDKLQFNDEDPIPWNTVEAINHIKSLPQ